MNTTLEDVSRRAVLHGLQHWGQSEADRVKAWQGVVDAAGICSTVTKAGMWGRGIEALGDDGPRAVALIAKIQSQFPLGRFEDEQEMVEREIAAARQ